VFNTQKISFMTFLLINSKRGALIHFLIKKIQRMKSQVKVYARVKPSTRYLRSNSSKYGAVPYEIDKISKKQSLLRLYSAKGGKHRSGGSAVMDSVEVPFTQVFSEDASQEEVFDLVGKSVVLK
jgi:hypothetical protein